MNTIITIKRLVDMLTAQANIPEHKAKTFVESFTYEIKEGLKQDKNVKVKDLGEFSVEGEKIIFVPDVTFASVINAPFAMFEPEVLADGITSEQLSQPIAPVIVPEAKEVIRPEDKPIPEPVVEESVVEESVIVEEPKIEKPIVEEPMVGEPMVKESIVNEAKEPEPIVEANLLVDPQPIYAPKEAIKEEEQPITESEEEEKPEPEPDSEPYLDSEPQKEYSFPTFWVIIGLLTGLILGIGIGFFVHDPIQEYLEPSLSEENLVISDEELAVLDLFAEESPEETTDQAPEQTAPEQAVVSENAPKAEPTPAEEKDQAPIANPAPVQDQTKPTEVYDIVTNNLAALSKKHYGDKAYWVYIYLENKDKIPNPNRVSNNIKLKIPPLEKYATQATEAERREAANKKATEILSKFK